MEAFPDYYVVLGVPRFIKEDGIRRAYLREAWRHHPDLCPDDPDAESSMTSINVAYATLSDPIRRAEYDAQRSSFLSRSPKASYTARGGRRLSHASRARRRCPLKSEDGLFGTALALLGRFIRYAVATLPL